MDGIKKYEHLHPRTATFPITLSQMLAKDRRERLTEDDRLTPEYKAWFDSRTGR